MAPPDDIPLVTTTSQTERATAKGARPQVGPESEVRGGPEAADETLDETEGEARRPQG